MRGLTSLSLIVVVLLIVALMAYIRLTPLPAARFHKRGPDKTVGEQVVPIGFEVVLPLTDDPQAQLAALDRIILNSPRTRRLAGSLADGHLSYVSRTAFWGFPDITNVWIGANGVHIRGRQRFGGKDFGVNATRIRGWVARLSPA